METRQTREKYIDIARGIVIILMVIGHSGPPKPLHKLIYSFHMPFFFLLSGYLFSVTKWQAVPIKDFLRQRAKAYLLPYVVLCGINWLYNIGYILFTKQTGIASRLLIGLLEIGYAGRFIRLELATTLWFLPCLFLSNLFLYLIYKIKRADLRLCTAVLAFAAAILIPKSSLYTFSYKLPWHADAALAGLFFMYLGTLMKNRKHVFEAVSLPIMLAALAISLYAGFINETPDMNTGIYGNPILLTVGSVLMFYVILGLSQKISSCAIARTFEYWGQHTVFFIGFSGIVHYTLSYVWKHCPLTAAVAEPWYVQALIVILMMTLVSFLWDRLKRRFPKIAIF